MLSFNSFIVSPRNRVLRRDLYYLVKFLPAYQLPAGMPSAADLLQSEAELNSTTSPESDLQYGNGPSSEGPRPSFASQASGLHHRNTPSSPAILPQHVNDVSPNTPRGLTINPDEGKHIGFSNLMSPRYIPSRRSVYEKERFILNKNEEESDLLPAYMPPKYSYFDLFPFSLLVKFLTEKGKEVRGKKAAKWRARLRNQAVSHNLPLEISLYIVSNDLLVFTPSVTDAYSSEFLCCKCSTWQILRRTHQQFVTFLCAFCLTPEEYGQIP